MAWHIAVCLEYNIIVVKNVTLFKTSVVLNVDILNTA
jgi:hypothetical protein